MKRLWMNWNLTVSILQVDGEHPIVLTNGLQDRPGALHVELGQDNKPIQGGEVYDKMPSDRSLLNDEHPTLEPQRRGSKIGCPFLDKSETPPDVLFL